MWRSGLLIALALPAAADTVVATRTIRAMAVIGPEDVALAPGSVPGTLGSPADALGMEARVTLYAGRPIRAADIGPPAVVERNQIVPLVYQAGPLSILAEGRALARAGIGDTIRVMNLASRFTVSGRVRPDGTVVVGP
jgi:flagella basal body P-ring formation protein FlgA